MFWNPVRVIQRFGRIDRLNSFNATVQMVNFWPTDDLEEYLNLNRRVKSKMALVDVTGTGDDDLLSPELISEEFRFRDKQLQKLQNGELPELENTEAGLNLTECLGKTQADEALWRLFNKRPSANSTDRALDRLAHTAVDTIVKHFQKDTLKSLFARLFVTRGVILPMNLNNPEALNWLQTNPNLSPFASNRFDKQGGAIDFVKRLYELGCHRVAVANLSEEEWRIAKEGGPYAETAV